MTLLEFCISLVIGFIVVVLYLKHKKSDEDFPGMDDADECDIHKWKQIEYVDYDKQEVAKIMMCETCLMAPSINSMFTKEILKNNEVEVKRYKEIVGFRDRKVDELWQSGPQTNDRKFILEIYRAGMSFSTAFAADKLGKYLKEKKIDTKVVVKGDKIE